MRMVIFLCKVVSIAVIILIASKAYFGNFEVLMNALEDGNNGDFFIVPIAIIACVIIFVFTIFKK